MAFENKDNVRKTTKSNQAGFGKCYEELCTFCLVQAPGTFGILYIEQGICVEEYTAPIPPQLDVPDPNTTSGK